MTKAAIRKLYRQKRMDISASAKERLEDLMLIQFQSLKLEIPDNIMTFAPIEIYNEYNPILIEEYCFFKNQAARLIYPVTNLKNNTVQPFITKEDTLFEVNEFQIDEPVNGIPVLPIEIEMMFLPLLGFNEDGYRVGYGKGFYDRLINDCNPDMLKIGFSYFGEVVIDDINEYDKKMDICITPDCIFQF